MCLNTSFTKICAIIHSPNSFLFLFQYQIDQVERIANARYLSEVNTDLLSVHTVQMTLEHKALQFLMLFTLTPDGDKP